MSTPTTPEPTPFQKFEALAKRIVSAPKEKVDALQNEWKKTKHKRGPKSLLSS